MSETKMKPGNICWFEIPANDVPRAQKFYSSLFGWKISSIPGMTDYWHIDTGGADDSPDGGMMKRKHDRQPITNYVWVESVVEASKKVKDLGGSVCVEKTEVPNMGYFAICRDTEGNEFAVWEMIPH